MRPPIGAFAGLTDLFSHHPCGRHFISIVEQRFYNAQEDNSDDKVVGSKLAVDDA